MQVHKNTYIYIAELAIMVKARHPGSRPTIVINISTIVIVRRQVGDWTEATALPFL